MAAALLNRAVERYNAALVRAPLLINASTGFVIAAAGDVACQAYFEGKGAAWDGRRTLDMGIIRALFMAPFLMRYFPFLNALVPGKTMPRVLARVGADQLIGSPIVICLTFGAAAVLQGRTETLGQRIQQQAWPTWLAGATYWPLVHSLNFRFVPVVHQTLVAHVMSLYWNAVLSYRSNKSLDPEAAGDGGGDGAPSAALMALEASSAAAAVMSVPLAGSGGRGASGGTVSVQAEGS